ncbi:MAG: 2-hydroxychromene-2-carboxylate isomerase [Pseudomonadota bacterium]
MQIDFYFDFMSPFAYLAHGRVADLANNYGCDLNYVPIDIAQAKLAAGNTGPANRDVPVKLRYLMTDIERWAALDQLPVKFPSSLNSARMNIGVFYAIKEGKIAQYVSECFTKGWGEGADIGAEDTLSDIANAMGWSSQDFLAATENPAFRSLYQEANSAAHARGVFGVPTFMIGDEMWWGNDRLHFLESFLLKVGGTSR